MLAGQLLTPVEEKALSDMIDNVAEWGFPLGRLEIRMVVRDLYDAKHLKLGTRDNMPGKDWFSRFVSMNKLLKWASANMKRVRAKVSVDMVEEFFDEVERGFGNVVGGEVKVGNIFNYDETNFTNDPGRSVVFVRRGRKRVENVKEMSKQAFLVMWCGSVAGDLLPLMVVYKAKNVYEGWTKNGPAGAIYDSTQSGWFDSYTFHRWFMDLFLPSVRGREGPFFLFGDNLGSHFSPEVVELAKEHNICFIMLIANANNWLQVLDVAVVGPMKRMWRDVLSAWRSEFRRTGDISKEIFPSLMEKLDRKVRETVSENLKSGFRACGIYPLDRNEALKRLPDYANNSTLILEECTNALNETLIELLKENRGCSEKQKLERGKKIPKKVEGLKPTVAGRVLENHFVISTYEEEQQPDQIQYPAPGPSKVSNIETYVPAVPIKLSYNEICLICGELEGDDGEWVNCKWCNRWYHDHCLVGQTLSMTKTHLYCDSDDEDDDEDSAD